MATTTPTSDLATALGADPGVERIYDNVQMQVPAVGLAAIKLVLWNTIEDFFIQSTVRREHLYWKMAAGVQAIDFNPFDAAWLVAWILDIKGLPSFKVEPPSILRDLTYPAPESERLGEVWLALKPVSFDAITCTGSDIWSTWFETILAGTLYRLYAQPAKPYTSPQLAQLNAALYRRGVGMARGLASRGHGPNRPVGFPYFAAGRR